MAKIEVVRHVAADPASVALLLAGPAPDSSDVGGTAAAQGLDGDRRRGLHVSPPRRSGVGFRAAVSVSASDGLLAVGEVRVEPAADPGCDIRIVLRPVDPARVVDVRREATGFLAGLSRRARSRSYAA